MQSARFRAPPGRRRLCLLPFAASAAKDTAIPPDISAQALELLKRSVGFETVAGKGNVPAYAEYLAGELKAHGFAAGDIEIKPRGETATLTAIYHGTDPKAKPILLAAHMDVVVAKREEWERDPFTAVVENGYVYGRGTDDNKLGLVSMMAARNWLKQEGFKPRRDIVLALTGDEETTQASTAALSKEWTNAELLLNSDAGGAYLGDDGKPTLYTMQAAEKTYMDFEVTYTSPGGHSSRPGPDNAIYNLAHAIDKVAAFHFPARISELTRGHFKAAGPITPRP